MSIQQQIKELVESNDVVLFMKGSPDFPQCGFSSRASQILKQCGANFASVDVLQNQEVREGIKQYSNWPTIPQLYIRGEFVGGSDIVMEMFENGELQKKLSGEA
jgi:monothiol glutaredoxin